MVGPTAELLLLSYLPLPPAIGEETVPSINMKLSKAHAAWLPKSLTIRGMEHVVVCADSLRTPEGGVAWGYYHGSQNIIIVSRETPPAARGMVLLHETIHALSDIDDLQIDTDQRGEDVVRSLGNGINACIMDNRKAWNRIWQASSRSNL